MVAKKPAVAKAKKAATQKKPAAAKVKKATPSKKASPKPKAAKSPAAKKSPKASPKPKTSPKATKSPAAAKTSGGASKLIIEHTKECGCFGVRATRLVNAMKAVKPNISFVVNPEKARKGTFELRTEGGKVLWSMTGLVRPFPAFKAVDFEELGKKLAGEL